MFRMQRLATQLRGYSSEAGVHMKKEQSIRSFVLDRPKALNALNLNMIYQISPQLQAWQESILCKVIVFHSLNSSKAFCAGGDVKELVLAAKNDPSTGLPKAYKFFQEEYRLNHLLATSKKPVLSILDGVTMGGGVGLSVHGHFRIVTENTLVAMPETAIGLFPDVGASFFLPRLDGELGTFLGLTGHRLKGVDAYIAGFGTHYVPSSRIDSLMARLAELESDELEVVNAAIDEFSGDVSADQFTNWSLGGNIAKMIDDCFKFNTMEEIIAAVEEVASKEDASAQDDALVVFAQKTLKALQEASPTSLKVTLSQLRRGRTSHIAECLKMEYRMAQKSMTASDFSEGVIAKLVEKRKPVWNPSTLQEVTESKVESFFSQKTVADLEFHNRLSFYDYPHRTLSGLPTDRDVARVVCGEGRRGTSQTPPRTKREVMEWFKRGWGRYDSGVIAEIHMPKQNTLDGGCGSGKVGLLEKVQAVLDRHTTETEHGLKWH